MLETEKENAVVNKVDDRNKRIQEGNFTKGVVELWGREARACGFCEEKIGTLHVVVGY